MTVAGDVVGLVDDNPVTKHVFKGVISRQFLRFGAGAQSVAGGLPVIHDMKFDGPDQLQPLVSLLNSGHHILSQSG